MLKRTMMALAISASVAGAAQADVDTFPYAVGLQGTSNFYWSGSSAGLSFKSQLNQNLGAQIIADPFGQYKTISGRVIIDFEQQRDWKAYGYGEAGLHMYDNNSIGDDYIGVSVAGGAGMQYDIRGLEPSLPPVAVSLDIGAGGIFFNNDSDIDFTASFGLHYHFGQ